MEGRAALCRPLCKRERHSLTQSHVQQLVYTLTGQRQACQSAELPSDRHPEDGCLDMRSGLQLGSCSRWCHHNWCCFLSLSVTLICDHGFYVTNRIAVGETNEENNEVGHEWEAERVQTRSHIKRWLHSWTPEGLYKIWKTAPLNKQHTFLRSRACWYEEQLWTVALTATFPLQPLYPVVICGSLSQSCTVLLITADLPSGIQLRHP